MARFTYRGYPSRSNYVWIGQAALPAQAFDGNGNLLTEFSYNSETLVWENDDGSIRRGSAGGFDPANPYGPHCVTSEWEQL